MINAILSAMLCVPPAFAGPAPRNKPDLKESGLFQEVLEACRKGTPDVLKLIPRMKSEPTMMDDIFSRPYRPVVPLVFYQACLAVVTNQEKACRQGVLDQGMTGRSICPEIEIFASFARVVFKGGNLAATCRRFRAGLRAPEVRMEDFAWVCDAFAAAMRLGKENGLCGKEGEAGLTPDDEIDYCRQRMVALQGSPKLCAAVKWPHPTDQDYCREKAALLAALRSGDAKECAASPLCKALGSGRSEDCAPYLAQARKMICAGAAQRKADQ
mgnify:CR=1 FL=1